MDKDNRLFTRETMTIVVSISSINKLGIDIMKLIRDYVVQLLKPYGMKVVTYEKQTFPKRKVLMLQ